MRALEVFDFKHYLSGPSDHQVDAQDDTFESMGSSRIQRNFFIWVLVLDGARLQQAARGTKERVLLGWPFFWQGKFYLEKYDVS
jgi:hypothetical protein